MFSIVFVLNNWFTDEQFFQLKEAGEHTHAVDVVYDNWDELCRLLLGEDK